VSQVDTCWQSLQLRYCTKWILSPLYSSDQVTRHISKVQAALDLHLFVSRTHHGSHCSLRLYLQLYLLYQAALHHHIKVQAPVAHTHFGSHRSVNQAPAPKGMSRLVKGLSHTAPRLFTICTDDMYCVVHHLCSCFGHATCVIHVPHSNSKQAPQKG
jgi:hypothetical protein